MPADVTESEFTSTLTDLGVVSTGCKLTKVEGTNPTGIIWFKTHQAFGEAAKVLDASQIKGKSFERVIPNTKLFGLKSFNEKMSIFVKNLPDEATNQNLFEIFSPFGTILACQILRDKMQVSKHSAHVNYYEEDAPQKAIAGLNGKPFPGFEASGVLLYVAKYQFNQFVPNNQQKNLVVNCLPFGMSDYDLR